MFAGQLVNLLFIEQFKRIALADLTLKVDRESHHADIFI